MTETTYTYVKGSGWVPTSNDYDWHEAITIDGYRVRYRIGLPNEGEGWFISIKSKQPPDWKGRISVLTAEYLMEPASQEVAEMAKIDKNAEYIVVEMV